MGEAGDKPYTKASRLTEAITKGEEMDSKGEEGLKQPLSVVGGRGGQKQTMNREAVELNVSFLQSLH